MSKPVGKQDIDSLFQLSEKSAGQPVKRSDSSDSIDATTATTATAQLDDTVVTTAAPMAPPPPLSSGGMSGADALESLFSASGQNITGIEHDASLRLSSASSSPSKVGAPAAKSSNTSILDMVDFAAPNIRRRFRICRRDNFNGVFAPDTPADASAAASSNASPARASGTASPAAASPSKQPGTPATPSGSASPVPQQQPAAHARAAALLTAPIVQIPVAGLNDILTGIEAAKTQQDDTSHLPSQPNAKVSVEPKPELPSAFDMPARLRCDFCLRFDSLCFHCHKKWREVEQPHRRNAVVARLNEMPEGARTALFFSSCARGSADFVKLVLQGFPNATRWVTELHPTKLDLAAHEERNGADIRDAWDDLFVAAASSSSASSNGSSNNNNAFSVINSGSGKEVEVELLPPPRVQRPGLLRFCGRHSALHVAVAYDRIDNGELLIAAAQSLVRSDRKLLACQLLPEDPLPGGGGVGVPPSAASASSLLGGGGGKPRAGSLGRTDDDDDAQAAGSDLTSLARDHQREQEALLKKQQQQSASAAGSAAAAASGPAPVKPEWNTEDGESASTPASSVAASSSTPAAAALADPRDADDYVPKSLRGDDGRAEKEAAETPEQRLHRWHELFARKPVIAELILANKARRFRTLKQWDDADRVYRRLLKRNPRNEAALCGRAKMLYDRGMLDECIKQCRDVIHLDSFGGVQWVDFDPQTIHYLMENALRTIHDRAHAVGGAALKPCGCVYTDRVRLPSLLVRLPQALLCQRVAPFIDVPSAFTCARAFTGARVKRGLLGIGRGLMRALQQQVSLMPVLQLTHVLYSVNPEIAAVINQLRQFLPRDDPARWLAPYASRGFAVVAFCDFDKIMVRAIVSATNPVFKKTMFAKSRGIAPYVAVCKEFTIRMQPLAQRVLGGGDDAPQVAKWDLQDSSEWEVDPSIVIAEAVK